jgi:hypothetical protein
MLTSYHTTTPDPQRVIDRYEAKAQHQDEIVLAWFKRNPLALATPEEVWHAVLPQAPLTSVRRALTNLTNRGLLLKTDHTRTSQYGRNAHTWCLHRPKQAGLF